MMNCVGSLKLAREAIAPCDTALPSTEKNEAVIKGSGRPISPTILRHKYLLASPR
jgi:hypothetical protein